MDHQQLYEIGIKKRNKEISESWNALAEKHSKGFFRDGESYRLWVKNRINSDNHNKLSTYNKEKITNEQVGFKESVDINKDGTQTSNKLVKMSLEQTKDPNYLLKAHGYDIESWELISSKSNIWNVYSKTDGISTLYSSKISVKPRVVGFSFERLIETLDQVEPIEISNNNISSDNRMLEVALYDMHWGISDWEYYMPVYQKIINNIKSKQWEQVLFIIGQDNFHNDNHRGQTSSGTMIETVDMEKAWHESSNFYVGLISEACRNANSVKIIYSKGNHDESLSWAFVKYLGAKFPNVEIDDLMVERKIHIFGKNFIGITHGDKGRKNLHNIFPVEFPHEWANAKNREIHIGHLHVEDAKDVFGMVIRTLATKNKTDSWHKDNGYVGAHKRFMLFEYSLEELESIHYI